MKVKFYVAMAVVMIALLANAIWQTYIVNQKTDEASLGRYETLSYHECAARFLVLREILSGSPKTPREYFTNLGKAYMLEGSARKALRQTMPVQLSSENDRDEIITRDVPVQMQGLINNYASHREGLAFMGRVESAKWAAAAEEFQKSGVDTIVHDSAPVIIGAEKLGFWWFLFHVGAMPFIFIHYCIRIRDNGMKVRYELLGNPAFPLWLFFWEIGLFRYPREINVMAQLRRAQRWAAFVLSSAIPCFAANVGGKVCEKTPVRYSMSTSTMSQYPGLEGAVFYPYPVQQSSLTVSIPCGLYAGLWSSEPLRHWNIQPNNGNEVDAILGWSGSVKGNTLDVSGTYLNVSPLLRAPEGDVFQFSERITRTVPLGKNKKQSVAPYFWFRQALPVRGSTPIGGWFAHEGFTYSRSFGSKVSNAADFETVWDSGAFGYNPAFIGRFLDTVTWKRGEHVSLQVPLIVQTPLSHAGDSRRTNFTGGLTLAFSF